MKSNGIVIVVTAITVVYVELGLHFIFGAGGLWWVPFVSIPFGVIAGVGSGILWRKINESS